MNERHGIDEKLAVSISCSGVEQGEKRTESFEEDTVARSEIREKNEKRIENEKRKRKSVEEAEQTEIDLAEGSATNLAAKTELVRNPRFHSMSGELNPRD